MSIRKKRIIKKTFLGSLVFVLVVSFLTISNFSIKNVFAEAAVTCGLCWVNPDASTVVDPPTDWTDSEAWEVVNLPGYPKTLIPTGSALEWEEFIIHYPGSHVTLADPAINPTVSIAAASGVGSDCVTLNGSITDMNESTWSAAYFTYGIGSSYDIDTDPVLFSATGSTSVQVCSLDPAEVYNYRLIVTNLNNNKSVFSTSASFTTDKDAQSAPSAPIVIDAGETYITLNTVSGCEYMRDGGGTWQSSPTFGGLTSETSYTFYQRYAETTTQSASPSSASTTYSTLAGFDCGTDTIIYDGVTYGTFSLGDQCWLDKNINTGTMLTYVTSQPNTADGVIEKWCYDSDPDNCDIYGGLYNWNEAMRGSTTEGDQGICPTGWYIPSYTEMDSITSNEDFNLSSPASDYPGYYSNNHYGYIDNVLYVWSSSLQYSYNAKKISFNPDGIIYRGASDFIMGFSVRCILGEGKEQQTAPSAPTVASIDGGTITLNTITNGEYKIAGGEWLNTAVFSGLDSETTYTFYQRYAETATQLASPASGSVSAVTGFICGGTVIYDGTSYGSYLIGTQCWLDKNLNVGTILTSGPTEPNTSDDVIEKWCYNNDSTICTTEGGLYSWDEAMQGGTAGAQGICPDGWHIPTDAEFTSNIATKEDLNITIYSGIRNSNGNYVFRSQYLTLWSSTEYSSSAWFRYFLSSNSPVYRSAGGKESGYSLRCLKD